MAEMAIGEKVTMEELGGARMHCSESGLGDILVKTEEEAIDITKRYLDYFPSNWKGKPIIKESYPPKSEKTISEIVPQEQNIPFDMYELINALVDKESFFEMKPLYAKELLVGFARLGGRAIGIVANQSKVKGGVLFSDSADKGAHFIWLCNAFNIPLLFLQDISGFMLGSLVEKKGIIRHGSKMLFAVAESTVPKITVLVRKAYGAGYMAMSGASFQADATIALPTAKTAIMGAESAINAIFYNKIM
ncbi:methylcrotonoyl-CoA carboxylase, partial [Aeromonas veronii]|nr:methylcrotonoyl-CoA carboxylase [Aeromonas veronii]